MTYVPMLDYDGQTPSEYALATWSRMTDLGFAPLDSLRLIEAQLKRTHPLGPTSDCEQALRMLDKWRVMIQLVRSQMHGAGGQDLLASG